MKQLTIFDICPEAIPEPEVGAWVTEHGPVIPHIMRKAYIGKKVLFDQSTVSMELYKVGILEDYFPYEKTFRSIVYTGKPQRSLIDHYNGSEIFELVAYEHDARRERRATHG